MSVKPIVLLVEDKPAVAEIVSAVLERNGYDVRLLTSADEVIPALESEEVGVVVSDASESGIDGFDLARRLRSDPASADIPIVLLTSLDSIEDQFDGYLAGADAYMTKPFRARELLTVIDRLLNKVPQPRSIGRSAASSEVARVLAVVTDDRKRMVSSAMRQAGFELQSENELAAALAMLDRERFHLVICDTVHDPDAVGQMRSFLEHFALATPVIFLHPRNAMPVLPANDPQFHALRVPATSADLAELARRVVLDFSGL